MARGFKIADAYAEIHADLDTLRRGAAQIPSKLGPDMDRAGKDMGKRLGKSLGDESTRQGTDAGGKLAMGMRLSIIRNSPLIVAAVGAALAFGGPAMLTAATGLFAGIGIVAAVQSDKVKSAWLGTWKDMQEGVEEAANPIENVLIGISTKVTATLNRILPAMGRMFDALAPQVDVFADGLLGMTENALPGMFRAIERGMPVTQGFADFLGKTGTGLSDFFDRISSHSGAAGQVFSSLGDSMAKLLPLLGELLGQGAELAATVLPLLSGSLGLVLSAVTAIGPALGPLVAGFSALKIVGTLEPLLTRAAASLSTFAAGGGMLAGTAGKASGALTGLAAAAGPVGFVVAAVAGSMAYGEQQARSWAEAIAAGGDAARKATAEHNELIYGIDQETGSLNWLTGGLIGLNTAFDQTDEKVAALRANMDPLEQAQSRVADATAYLTETVGKYGPTSNEAEGASRALKSAQGELEAQQGSLEQAIHGVTQAMLDQANQARGAIDADFAYQDALDALEDKQRALADAQAHLNDTNKDTRTTLEDVSDAQRQYAEGIWDTAQKAAAANPILDGLKEGTDEYRRTVDNLTLKSLVDMRAGLGPQMQGAVDGMIGQLQRGGASLDELGNKKPMPVVDANIDPLIGKVSIADGALAIIDGRRPLPGLDLATGPFNGKTETSFGLLDVLDGKRPLPVADLNPIPLNGQTQSAFGLLDVLGRQRPTPVAALIDNASGPARGIVGAIGQIQSKTVTITTVHQAVNRAAQFVGGFFPATGGQIGSLPKKAIRRSMGGRVVGPGTDTSDDVGPFATPRGPAWLSNTEWVIKAMSAQKYGDRLMKAVNDGTAVISLPQQRGQGFANGGTPAPSTTPARVSGNTFNVNVTLSGMLDTTDARAVRRVAGVLHSEFKQIERSLS